jgi:hypothetical protein
MVVGVDLNANVSPKVKSSSKLLLTIFKVTEADSESFKGPVIF